jgi:hypothetical protein
MNHHQVSHGKASVIVPSGKGRLTTYGRGFGDEDAARRRHMDEREERWRNRERVVPGSRGRAAERAGRSRAGGVARAPDVGSPPRTSRDRGPAMTRPRRRVRDEHENAWRNPREDDHARPRRDLSWRDRPSETR